MNRRFTICWLGLLLASGASAVAPLSTGELAAHCLSDAREAGTVDRAFCVRYIQGFIDGAVATDVRVTRNVAKEFEENESFAERAIRMRQSKRLDRFATFYAEFCLGEPVRLQMVVDSVIADLADKRRVANQPNARDFVYTTLRQKFPCKVAAPA